MTVERGPVSQAVIICQGLRGDGLNKEQNILFAQRNLVDSIWKSMHIEGFNTTYPQTYAIVERAKLSNISMDEVLVANNLKMAWFLVLELIDENLSVGLIKDIHNEVARGIALEWGKLRTGTVGVGGTGYKPPPPTEEGLNSLLEDILRIEDPRKRALFACVELIKGQFFWDGNKRTAMLIANKILIENGCGLLAVPLDQQDTFSEKLNRYYDFDEKDELVAFLDKDCIETIDLSGSGDQIVS